jgi:hypothetical protein
MPNRLVHVGKYGVEDRFRVVETETLDDMQQYATLSYC